MAIDPKTSPLLSSYAVQKSIEANARAAYRDAYQVPAYRKTEESIEQELQLRAILKIERQRSADFASVVEAEFGADAQRLTEHVEMLAFGLGLGLAKVIRR